MRATIAYFAGIGTVAVAIAAGLGGGLILGDIMSPQQPKQPSSEVTRLEQRSSQWPIPAKNDTSQPVPYLASSQVTAAIAEPAAAQPQADAQSQQQPPPQPQAQQPPQPQPLPQPQQQQATAQPSQQQAAVQPAEARQSIEPGKSVQTTAAPAQQPAARERTAPEDAFAKARDADFKREARDRRKAERRQRWAERQRMKTREHGNDDEMRDVEAKVREATERGPSERPLFDSGPRFGARGLFDDD